MPIASRRRGVRRGATVPLSAFVLVILFAMTAFAVDIGYIVVAQNELQNAADAAALAGASQLLLPQVTSNLSTDALAKTASTNAVAEAQKFSLLNQAGGTYLTLASSDVVVGTRAGSTVTPWSAGGAFPTSVQVTVYRSDKVNGPLPLFFGPLLGTPSWSGGATAAASVQSSQSIVTGFNPPAGGPNSLLLPIGIANNLWQQLVSTGQSPDGQVHDDYAVKLPTATLKAPRNIGIGSDNVPELTDSYPSSTAPGNFGLLDIGADANDTPTFSNWIRNGPSSTDLAHFGKSGLQATSDAPATLKGGPGLKSSLVSDLQAIVGQPRIVLLYSSYGGQGSNTSYSIVGFAGVTVVSATGRGSSEIITLQPMMVVDPTATTKVGSSTTPSFVYKSSPLQLSR